MSEHMLPYLTVYVEVPELRATLRRAVQLGASEVVPPTAIPGIGHFALFEDHDAHMVGLLEPVSGSGLGPAADEFGENI